MHKELQCMVDKGLIGQAEAQAISDIMLAGPTSQLGLLSVIAAALLNQGSGSNGNFEGEFIGSFDPTIGGGGGFTISAPDDAEFMVITTLSGQMFYRFDGGAASATEGHIIPVGVTERMRARDFSIYTSGNASAYVSYYK